eukprot:1158082-Pelagomonas_calceolata.AAC.9
MGIWRVTGSTWLQNLAVREKKERNIDACRSAACIKERASHRLPPIEGVFIFPPRPQGEGDALAQKSRESPSPRSCRPDSGSGALEVTGSTRLQKLAVRSVFVFNSMPSNKLVGEHNRMPMKFASKFVGTLVVKSQLFKL